MFGHNFVPHDYTCEVLQCFSEFRFVHAKKRSTRRTELESFHFHHAGPSAKWTK
jgi:hypothetical protein